MIFRYVHEMIFGLCPKHANTYTHTHAYCHIDRNDNNILWIRMEITERCLFHACGVSYCGDIIYIGYLNFLLNVRRIHCDIE